MYAISCLAGLSLLLSAAALGTTAPTSAAAEPATSLPGDEVEAPGPVRVAVPHMRTSGVDADLASTLTDVLTVEANKFPGVQAIGMADIEAVLGIEERKQLLGCDDVSCMAEIGGALGVGAIIASKLGKVGDTYILTVRAIDTKEVKVLGSTQETVAGKPDALIAAARRAVPTVLAPLTSDSSAPAATPVALAPAAPIAGGTNWPAIALTSVGAAGLTLAGLFGATALYLYFDRVGEPAVLSDGSVYRYPGGQEGLESAAASELVAWVALGVGLPATIGGVLWLLLPGDDMGEEG